MEQSLDRIKLSSYDPGIDRKEKNLANFWRPMNRAPLQRVLIVSEPGRDGVFNYVWRLVDFLHEEHPDIQVDLAYSSRRGGPSLHELIDQVESRQGRTLDLKVGRAPGVADLGALNALHRLIKDRQPQLIHANSAKAGGLCRIGRRFLGFPPVIYSPQGYYGMDNKRPGRLGFFPRVESILGRWAPTLNCSADERRFGLDVLRLPPRKLILLHHGIETARFRPATAEEKSEARRRLRLPSVGKILVTIGRVSSQKNYPALYRAMDRVLPETAEDIFFLHVGAGSAKLRTSLRGIARDRSFTFEFLKDLVPVLHAADGFIMTSRYEGLSLVMLYALACGLPMFLAASPGITTIRNLGFDKVRWFPSPTDETELENDIVRALLVWKDEPSATLLEQTKLARHWFDERIQQRKMYRTYTAIYETEKSEVSANDLIEGSLAIAGTSR